MDNTVCKNCGSQLTKQKDGYACENCGENQSQVLAKTLSTESFDSQKQARKRKKIRRIISIALAVSILFTPFCLTIIVSAVKRHVYLKNGEYGKIVEMDKLTEFVIHDGVTNIDDFAFYGCTGLMSVTIPDSVTSIGDSAFEGCEKLTNLVIPNSVTTIGNSAFYNCNNLTNITVPNHCQSIASYAFCGCNKVESIIISDNLTTIRNYVFAWCNNATSIIIGNGLTYIEEKAFKGCEKLTTVYYKGTENDWKNVLIVSNASPLIGATRYYYSETQPTTTGNYWRYDADGVTPVVWE